MSKKKTLRQKEKSYFKEVEELIDIEFRTRVEELTLAHKHNKLWSGSNNDHTAEARIKKEKRNRFLNGFIK